MDFVDNRFRFELNSMLVIEWELKLKMTSFGSWNSTTDVETNDMTFQVYSCTTSSSTSRTPTWTASTWPPHSSSRCRIRYVHTFPEEPPTRQHYPSIAPLPHCQEDTWSSSCRSYLVNWFCAKSGSTLTSIKVSMCSGYFSIPQSFP